MEDLEATLEHFQGVVCFNRKLFNMWTGKRWNLGVWLLLTAFVVAFAAATAARLRLVDGGYEGLMVGIAEDIPQSSCRELISGLKVSTWH